MDSLRKLLDAIVRVLMHPASVVTICLTVEEALTLLLDSLDMLPPAWRKPVSVGIAIAGLLLRGAKALATMQMRRDEADRAKQIEQSAARAQQDQHADR
jgi:hypothetical protein